MIEKCTVCGSKLVEMWGKYKLSCPNVDNHYMPTPPAPSGSTTAAGRECWVLFDRGGNPSEVRPAGSEEIYTDSAYQWVFMVPAPAPTGPSVLGLHQSIDAADQPRENGSVGAPAPPSGETGARWLPTSEEANRVVDGLLSAQYQKEKVDGSAIAPPTASRSEIREALEFYANVDNYFGKYNGENQRYPAITEDEGELARKALALLTSEASAVRPLAEPSNPSVTPELPGSAPGAGELEALVDKLSASGHSPKRWR